MSIPDLKMLKVSSLNLFSPYLNELYIKMAYTLFDKNGEIINHHDLQDKSVWCKDGFKTEEIFVKLYGNILGLDINPSKQTDPFAPDLIDLNSKNLADLKVQNTPFFKSKTLYNIDPRYAVVFNHKDRVRYLHNYPNIDIYYWIDWIAVGFKMNSNSIMIEPLSGIWKISMMALEEILSRAALHSYQQRQYDNKGNARESYVLDIRDPNFQHLL